MNYIEGTMDICKATQLSWHRNPTNRWTQVSTNQTAEINGNICSVWEVALVVVAINSTATPPCLQEMPTFFLDVLIEWGITWLWDSLRLVGEYNWLGEAIQDRTCLAVTDGLYIKELYPDLCSAAFFLEFSKGWGKLFGSFPEHSVAAGAYWGELLVLMAIHRILLAVNKVSPTLQGRAQIYSDCMGTLVTVATLPNNRIPCRCKHSDILKNIIVNFRYLTFACSYSHVKGHQDDDMAYQYLSHPYQLNCIMDDHSKKFIWGLEGL